jgi:hypothetical protein
MEDFPERRSKSHFSKAAESHPTQKIMQLVEEHVGAGRGLTSTKVLAPVSEGSLILMEAGLIQHKSVVATLHVSNQASHVNQLLPSSLRSGAHVPSAPRAALKLVQARSRRSRRRNHFSWSQRYIGGVRGLGGDAVGECRRKFGSDLDWLCVLLILNSTLELNSG